MAYFVDAATFDVDYMRTAALFTGLADGPLATICFAVKFDAAGDGVFQRIFNHNGSQFQVYKDASNILNLIVQDATFVTQLKLTSTSSYTSANGWLRVNASFNINFGAGSKIGYLYINDVDDKTVSNDVGAAANIGYTTGSSWSVGENAGAGTQLLKGSLAELWFSGTTAIDFSSTSNRRNFILSGLCPVNLGSNPTGSSPDCYLHLDDGEAVANFATNRGTGGNFTITGALATAETSPSDGCVDPTLRAAGWC